MVALPVAARKRLAQPLRDARALRAPERESHTLPVGSQAWRRHCDALVWLLRELARLIASPEGDFDAVRAWAQHLLDTRERAVSLLLALEPFAPFEATGADRLVRLIDEAIAVAADALENDVPCEWSSEEMGAAISWWDERDATHANDEVLRVAFRLPTPPQDDRGEFRAEWVLQHYAYNNGELLAQILPHLNSLGVPGVADVLAAVSIVGGILSCDDPIAAYIAMDAFLGRYLDAPPDVALKVKAHLEAGEPALRRAQQAASRAYAVAISSSTDAEFRALALADMYKRTVEGPFRQYSWALRCLRTGSWEPTPMLGNLRERLVSDGGFLAGVAQEVVLPDLRNSETHETLEWDGPSEEFVTEVGRVPPARVVLALASAEAFNRGCEAGMAAVRTLGIRPDGSFLPDPEEPGRMPSWRRARAYFGTNNLRLVEEHLNARHASVRIERLELRDVNPCFQAVLVAHRLLPRIEAFSVGTPGRAEPLITVSAAALELTMPVWEFALSVLDRMPLSTFLPANLDARSRVETMGVAIRAAAWIAADDVLDALDGSPAYWNARVWQLLDARLGVVGLATEQAIRYGDVPAPRLASVAASVGELRLWIGRTSPGARALADAEESVARLRLQWRSWGPVRRHPSVPEPARREYSELRPALHDGPFHKDYRTL